MENVIDIETEVLGEKHPSTATTYNNMALVYDNAKGEYDRALEYFEKMY